MDCSEGLALLHDQIIQCLLSIVEASVVSGGAIVESFQAVTLLDAWLLMGSFGRCCRGEIGGEALQDVRVYIYRTSLRYSPKYSWLTRKETYGACVAHICEATQKGSRSGREAPES